MLISANVETVKNNEKIQMVDGQPYTGREYVGSAPKPGTADYGKNVAGDAGPQAYLVTQPPGSVTRPHFHQTNQFQVFVSGGGTVGKMRADPVTVQYAGSNTPYGPIVAEDDGIQYFTLRQEWDSGAKYLPTQNDLLVKGVQRQEVGVVNDEPSTGLHVTTQTLIAPHEDGLQVDLYRLAPGASVNLPDAAAGGGQYHVVITGSLARDGAALGPLSIEFASPEAGEVEVKAGDSGLELVFARFPRTLN